MSGKCRICSETTQGTVAKDLFEPANDILINQIELLTGEWLKFDPNLPSQICICCETDLNAAAAFRERCIATQNELRYQQRLRPTKTDPLNIVTKKSPSPSPSPNQVSKDKDELSDSEFDDFEDNFELHSLHDEDDLHNDHELDEHDDEQLEFENEDEVYSQTNCKMVDNLPKKQILQDNSPIKIPFIGRLSFESLKQQPRKKYIRWKDLTQEQAKELKRLKRQRDCVCDQCGRHFNDSSNLKLHLLRHTGVKNFKCGTCDQLFYTPHLLRRHERLHTGMPLYSCQYCDKTFKYPNSKLDHERWHRDERPFECTNCEKAFRTSKGLRDHQLVHTKVRNYHCDVCGKSFLQRKNLLAHNKSKFHKENLEKRTLIDDYI